MTHQQYKRVLFWKITSALFAILVGFVAAFITLLYQ
jgi:hypothetical protein